MTNTTAPRLEPGQITEITRGLADAGKLIEAGWVGYRLACYPDGASEIQLQECRQAFFGGAQHLFHSILNFVEDGDDATENDASRMMKVDTELTAFLEDFKRKYGLADAPAPEAKATPPGPPVRSPDEILARIAYLQTAGMTDPFGAEITDLVGRLPFAQAKQFLKDDVTEGEWKPAGADRESIIQEMADYMAFAWTKANDCRGLSALRSLAHMRAWMWLAGEDALRERTVESGAYSHYGKPQLRAICEAIGVNWQELDDGLWRSTEQDPGVPADQVPAL